MALGWCTLCLLKDIPPFPPHGFLSVSESLQTGIMIEPYIMPGPTFSTVTTCSAQSYLNSTPLSSLTMDASPSCYCKLRPVHPLASVNYCHTRSTVGDNAFRHASGGGVSESVSDPCHFPCLENLNTALFLWLSSGYSARSSRRSELLAETCSFVFLQEDNNLPSGAIACNVLLTVRR